MVCTFSDVPLGLSKPNEFQTRALGLIDDALSYIDSEEGRQRRLAVGDLNFDRQYRILRLAGRRGVGQTLLSEFLKGKALKLSFNLHGGTALRLDDFARDAGLIRRMVDAGGYERYGYLLFVDGSAGLTQNQIEHLVEVTQPKLAVFVGAH